MDDEVVKEALSYSLGADLHEAWCEQELRAFFSRAQQAYEETNNIGQALRQACYKNGEKRNEVELDIGWLESNRATSIQCLTDFETFKKLFDKGVIEVKRFTKRELTPEEIAKAGNNYVDGKENILRDFSKLSSASQKDNLEAARVAVELVYEKTMSDEPITPIELEQMGSAIHEEWLGRNAWVYEYNPKLAVPYEQLPKDEQDKDKAQIAPAQAKVSAYKNGLLRIEQICQQYGIESPGKKY